MNQIKMSHISTIQVLEEAVGKPKTPFNELNSMTTRDLEKIRDELVKEYNKMKEEQDGTIQSGD